MAKLIECYYAICAMCFIRVLRDEIKPCKMLLKKYMIIGTCM